jgi:hypothetical protein
MSYLNPLCVDKRMLIGFVVADARSRTATLSLRTLLHCWDDPEGDVSRPSRHERRASSLGRGIGVETSLDKDEALVNIQRRHQTHSTTVATGLLSSIA